MTDDEKIEYCAMMTHEANRIYCLSIGDTSQPHWEDAPQWQKDSAINGIKFFLSGQGTGPNAMHNNWMRTKLADGWKYGQVKDPEKKEHPCLVPWDALPSEQRKKDYLFLGAAFAMASALRL